MNGVAGEQTSGADPTSKAGRYLRQRCCIWQKSDSDNDFFSVIGSLYSLVKSGVT